MVHAGGTAMKRIGRAFTIPEGTVIYASYDVSLTVHMDLVATIVREEATNCRAFLDGKVVVVSLVTIEYGGQRFAIAEEVVEKELDRLDRNWDFA